METCVDSLRSHLSGNNFLHNIGLHFSFPNATNSAVCGTVRSKNDFVFNPIFRHFKTSYFMKWIIYVPMIIQSIIILIADHVYRNLALYFNDLGLQNFIWNLNHIKWKVSELCH